MGVTLLKNLPYQAHGSAGATLHQYANSLRWVAGLDNPGWLTTPERVEQKRGNREVVRHLHHAGEAGQTNEDDDDPEISHEVNRSLDGAVCDDKTRNYIRTPCNAGIIMWRLICTVRVDTAHHSNHSQASDGIAYHIVVANQKPSVT